MKPIYEPKGAAKEYCDLALNIYTGCPHKCWYCYAPNILRKSKQDFHNNVEPRKNIVEETKKQLKTMQNQNRLIHLCFTCDPYPRGYDTSTTREIIKAIKESGNHVQILTKNPQAIKRDYGILDNHDWLGMSITCGGDNYDSDDFFAMFTASMIGFNTWVSLEPVLDVNKAIAILSKLTREFNKIYIGTLNHHKHEIDYKPLIDFLHAQSYPNVILKDSLKKLL